MTRNVNHIHHNHNESTRRRGLVAFIWAALAVLPVLFSLLASASVASAAPVDPADAADPVPPGFELSIDTDLLESVAAVTGHISLHCFDETQGGVAVVFTNHSDTPQYVHASVVKIPVQAYGNPPSALSETIPPGATANYVLGKWDNGTPIAVGISYAATESVAQESLTIQCGQPNPSAAVDSFCVYPGGFHIVVNLGNSGSGDAEFEVGLSSASPGDPAPAPELHTVKPGETKVIDFDVAHGASYQVSVRLQGASDFLIDETITFGCAIIDDQAPLPEGLDEADTNNAPGTDAQGTQSPVQGGQSPVQGAQNPAQGTQSTVEPQSGTGTVEVGQATAREGDSVEQATGSATAARLAAIPIGSSTDNGSASSEAVLLVALVAVAVTLAAAWRVLASILRKE